ncbi:MAG: SufD family Fe-S cluster assembly protein [bacterium]|nr:SufD family Fe-S cluster assembly protein [bacterium]
METIDVHVGVDEKRIVPIVWLGRGDRHVKARILMDAPGGSVKVLCIFFAKKGMFKLETEVIHDAPNTFSRTLVKGVLDGDAVANYEGLVVIKKGAKNADADLNEHAILLSQGARAGAIPRLEVLENEVKAGHGATVGKVGEEELFYLATRGLSRKEAKKMIVRGFLESFVDEFPPAESKEIRSALLKL